MMDYELVNQLRAQLDDIDDVIRDKRAELQKLGQPLPPGGVLPESPPMTASEVTRRQELEAEIAQYEAQKKEIADILTRALQGF
jgi:hypothetical protein